MSTLDTNVSNSTLVLLVSTWRGPGQLLWQQVGFQQLQSEGRVTFIEEITAHVHGSFACSAWYLVTLTSHHRSTSHNSLLLIARDFWQLADSVLFTQRISSIIWWFRRLRIAEFVLVLVGQVLPSLNNCSAPGEALKPAWMSKWAHLELVEILGEESAAVLDATMGAVATTFPDSESRQSSTLDFAQQLLQLASWSVFARDSFIYKLPYFTHLQRIHWWFTFEILADKFCGSGNFDAL